MNLLCGLTITGSVSLNDTEVIRLKDQLAGVSSNSNGTFGLSQLTGGVSGDLDVSAAKLGTNLLSENVIIYQSTASGLEPISLSQIPSARIPASGVVYARTNWTGKIDLLVLTNAIGSDYIFGRTHYTMDENGKLYLEVITRNATYTSNISGGPEDGIFVGMKLTKDGRIESTLALNKFSSVANNAWRWVSVSIRGRDASFCADPPFVKKPGSAV